MSEDKRPYIEYDSKDGIPIMPESAKGVWVVYCYDAVANIESVHETELEALRVAVRDHNHAVFLPYGKQFREVLT